MHEYNLFCVVLFVFDILACMPKIFFILSTYAGTDKLRKVLGRKHSSEKPRHIHLLAQSFSYVTKKLGEYSKWY